MQNSLKPNDKKELIDQITQLNESEKTEKEETKETNQTIFFVSFDVVNSTKYKTLNSQWYNVISSIFDQIVNGIKEFKNESIDVHFWKYLGDELIFWFPVQNIKELHKMTDKSYRLLQRVCDFIKNSKFESIPKKDILSVKATAWIATVTNFKNPTGNIVNFHKMMKAGVFSNFEFMGPDIDAGFRIAKETEQRQLTISFELAYLLLELYSQDDNLRKGNVHLKTFTKLKGVWDESSYPIYWYFTETTVAKNITQTIKPSSFFADNIYNKLDSVSFDSIVKIVELERPSLENKLSQIKEEIHANALVEYTPDSDWNVFINGLQKLSSEKHNDPVWSDFIKALQKMKDEKDWDAERDWRLFN